MSSENIATITQMLETLPETARTNAIFPSVIRIRIEKLHAQALTNLLI